MDGIIIIGLVSPQNTYEHDRSHGKGSTWTHPAATENSDGYGQYVRIDKIA